MNLTELLENLSAKNVELRMDGDKLRCRAPENVLTSELLAQIKQYKQEIIQFLSNGTDHPSTYSLSHGQQALWFLYQLAPNNTAYNTTYAARLVTNLDIAALKQATQVLIERHPVLRTTFTSLDGEPVQTVHENQQVDFSIIEASALGQEDVNKWLKETSDRPFDLEKGPLLCFSLLINHTTLNTLATKEHFLLITAHHIVVDFWSLEIIISELRVLYEAITTDVEPLLPSQNCQYRDYVNWSKQMLAGIEGERLSTYWRQQLSGDLPVLNLPKDRPRAKFQTYNGASCFFALEEKLLQKLKELAAKDGVSLYTLLLAALQILLLRYTNQKDILIGSPMVNRSSLEFENIVGYFTNPVVLRTDMSGNPTFQELLGRSRSSVLEALDHQDYPFPLLVEEMQPVRDPSYSPLYQVAFAWDRSHQSEGKVSITDSDRLIVESMIPGTQGAAFDLTLTILDVPGALKGTWNYNTDLFDGSTIERMSVHFVTLLEGIVANPVEQIAQLPLLTESESQQLLVEWNRTQTDYPSDSCIHSLFEAQSWNTPDAVALVYENQQLTYTELNTQANQLAHYLKSIGVGPDVLVGICVERSLFMIVGLLGILKAGGAYVPLDPEYPTERLSFVLEDAQIRVLLTQQQLVQKLPEHTAQLVCLDSDWEKIVLECQSNPLNITISTNLAYVIYTSGSTGKPKGVLVNHSNVVRLFAATNWYNFNSDDVWTLFHSYAFDFSVWEIWGALLYGGRLVVVPYLVTRSPESFYKLLSKEKVTILNQTPSAFRQLIQVEQSIATVGVNLRLVIFGGEALEFKSLQPWFERHGDKTPQLVNMYGITETTVHVTNRPLSSDDLKSTASVIGRPLLDLQVYILDEHLQPMPIGVGGEMYVGGAGVARGYLNRPELTQQRFISNPFAESLKARLYKTGDLARYLPSGELEYLGRIDNQVKIRGFRIELGEIEALLAQHPAVWENVAVVRSDELNDKRLVAYVVPQHDVILTISELRQFLKAKLPDYMVPSTIVILKSLPMTANAKVDKSALPEPELSSERLEQFVAPRTPIEEILALQWAQVLKLKLVSIHDNFFELGGHSLLATQLISRIRTHLQVELPLRSLFAAPTVAELAQVIIELQQQDLQLSTPPILPRDSNGFLPLSFAQQRLWFLDQFEPSSTLYNIPIALRLVGTLNVGALEQSLALLIARHEALRTNMISVSGQPVQMIHSSSDWTLAVVDCKDLARSDLDIATEQLLNWQALQPFDLATGTLVRATLLVLSPTEHILLVCMHHIISDGWSMGVLLQEMSALYNADCTGHVLELAALPIQYADFAIWQRQWLTGDVLQTQLAYWLKQLANAPALLSLPTDRPRPSVQTFCGAHQQFTLSIELSRGLTQLTQQFGVTLFMTLLAGFETLLYRYTGQTDILVGTPIANRNRREIEGLIGFFVNTIILRTDLADNPSFSELLERVKSMPLSAYAHQDLPLEMLVEALQPERDLSYTPLFQVMFVLQNAPLSIVELTELSVSPLQFETHTAKFDLSLSMENTNSGLVGVWEYNTDLFDASTIERMSGHFVTLLEGIVANPVEHIAQLPLLTELEQHQLLVEWNQTQTDYPQDKCIHQLFELQVELTPDAVAVIFEDQQLTYQQLNTQANQLAHYLLSIGVGADVLVGICVERSLEMLVGLLGILKAGGAYVPLDPEYPIERLSFMLSDAQVSVLLTQHHLEQRLPEYTGQLVYLDTNWQSISQSNQDNLITEGQASNLAYVIYTSGSTGTPKGVAVTHQAVSRLVLNTNYIHLTPNERVAQAANVAFDAATFEIWGTLLNGAKLVIISKSVLLVPKEFSVNLSYHEVSVLFLTTALFNQLASLAPQAFSCLKYLLFGGEAVDPSWVQQVLDKGAPQQLLHVYGPTENTTFSSWYLVEHIPALATTIPIGRPIANTQIYILNKYLQPVPVGVPGELYLGGAGVARGYFNRPDLTLEKFIPNPFGRSSNSERLYKTGDLARYLPDGNIEYIGRIDNQVKIRGFRIELGEIEIVLSQHAQVHSVVVIARQDPLGDQRLVAYVVPQNDLRPTISSLRQFLQVKLPDYMVPSAIVILESLPLTPNGKIDKSALPSPELSRERLDQFVAPRTPIEEILILLWVQVLKVQVVGIHDNFFTLGGHSLLATQLISRIRTHLQVELPLRSLFAAPTVAELAQVIIQLQQQDLQLVIPPILPRDSNALLPLSFAQQRLWFLDQFEPSSALYNIPLALRLVGTLNVKALEQSLALLIARHEALRTNMISVSGQPVQMIHSSSDWTLAVVDCKDLARSDLDIATEQLLNWQALQPFDLATGTLVRATLLVLSPTEHILLVCMHHIISDGWSMGVLLQEMSALYNADCTGHVLELAALPIQYADFAIWQRQWLTGDVLQTQLAYWLKQLANAPALLSLPTDRPRPSVQTFCGAHQQFTLSIELSRGLTQLTQQFGVTLFMTLLAGFETLLYRYTGQTDILVGTPIANRNRREIEGLIGFFVNTIILRTDLADNPSFSELLERVKSMPLSAYAHQDLPLEMLVEALQPERDLSYTPLFQVMFVLQNAPLSIVELTELSVSPLQFETHTAKFDLSLSMENTNSGLVGVWEYNTDLFDA
ncbi:MAG: amino acid adenylation domain-containing protein, partial [Rhizonema sp. NSF051]|nr:amino acid adenylation domain-containing protein [Rhizonema sp. NSF051]